MILLDTTVLLYAKGAEHRFRAPCRDLIAAIADGRIEASTTPEVIQEFVHVRARRRGRRDAAALGRSYAAVLSPLVSVTADHLERGLAIYEPISSVGAFDAVLAAVTESAGAILVSADAAFGEIPEIAHIVPDAAGVAGLLGAT
ncbi:type II toxin-antitoxin system VapC family toxin [[Mycobacterium] kokjensenii]|uniref:Ribonuclease VapC n=1 Tax=[Mycobacterium] kokjensenii TaxID=3064287 RepID=A0ABM9L7D5_9MYCO|nr:type II toxin-antitoxin system VapC family toxin [Mycolicibacter sp. MU0083]CAJ1493934.1 type II toxin-antitoxin system VapC family toxin [Mycolicibacter sp. MU0083]